MDRDLEKARDILNSDGVVGMPTETVYGLAARIDRIEGIRRIFTTKERPFFDPLIVHVADIPSARALVRTWPEAAQSLAEAFWPGPLTLVLPKSENVDPLITSGLETVGLRSPDHSVALELIRAAGAPLAAPSANKFGRTSPTTRSHVEAEFQGSVFVLEGGPCRIGIESTVLSIGSDGSLSVLRKGAITPTQIAEALQSRGLRAAFYENKDRRLAPGQMQHHYMPAIPLVWAEGPWTAAEITRTANEKLALLPDEIEGVRIRKPKALLIAPARLELDPDPAVAARELYAELRRQSESGADHLYFLKESHHDGEAWDGLLDRLSKAASLKLPKRQP